MATLSIEPIPAFTDNYIWCLHDGQQAVVVDPGDAAPVMAFLKEHSLELAGILVTHHHWDHVSGIPALTVHFPDLPVWGPVAEAIPGRTVALHHQDTVTLPLGVTFEVYDVPGHTLGHIAYYCADFAGSGPVLLCGDTLFSAGCGRLFEGTPEQMHHSLGLFKRLPAKTRIYCTHEYTQSNLHFAVTVEPDNQALRDRVQEVKELRAAGLPSLPTDLALELATNPFLRADKPAVVEAITRKCGHHPASEQETFAKLRNWKDNF